MGCRLPAGGHSSPTPITARGAFASNPHAALTSAAALQRDRARDLDATLAELLVELALDRVSQ